MLATPLYFLRPPIIAWACYVHASGLSNRWIIVLCCVMSGLSQHIYAIMPPKTLYLAKFTPQNDPKNCIISRSNNTQYIAVKFSILNIHIKCAEYICKYSLFLSTKPNVKFYIIWEGCGVNCKPSVLFSGSNGYAICVRPTRFNLASPVKHSF